MKNSLRILAGSEALKRLAANGIQSKDVSTIAGAAGGPKWLVLSQLDRALFATWIKPRENNEPLFLVGSSIGAWRMAAAAQKNPERSIDAFEKSYFQQRYSLKPSPAEVTRVSYEVMDRYLNSESIQELLNHPYYRLVILTVRCKHLLRSENRSLLLAGATIAATTNALHPKLLKFSFDRDVFIDRRDKPSFLLNRQFKARSIDLKADNFKKALMASGSIPGVMQKITDLVENEYNVHRDGGMMDYHLDLPYSPSESRASDTSQYILFPHYGEKIIPNWFDKFLSWRKPSAENLKNVILIAPSQEFIQRLPLGKIPDRHDFALFKGNDPERLKYWSQVVRECERLKDEFLEIFENNRVAEFAQPLFGHKI